MKIRVGFGLTTAASAGLTGEGFWTLIDALESGGWDSLWLSERATGDIPAPIAAIAAAAGRTRRLKFGWSVMVLPGRNPVLLAKELATIDWLSGGRTVPAFGLGADGVGGSEQAQVFGVDPRERAGRSDEAVVLMKRLWTEDAVTHEGRYFSVSNVTLRPRPAQQPHPDVWFGGHSAAAVRRVGRIGDGWLPSFISAGEYGEKADEVRRVASEAGREVDDEHYGALIPYAQDVPGPLLDLVRARRPDVDPTEVVVIGDEVVLRERLERFIEAGASKFVVAPVLPASDWPEELGRLREKVAAPLEN